MSTYAEASLYSDWLGILQRWTAIAAQEPSCHAGMDFENTATIQVGEPAQSDSWYPSFPR